MGFLFQIIIVYFGKKRSKMHGRGCAGSKQEIQAFRHAQNCAHALPEVDQLKLYITNLIKKSNHTTLAIFYI